MLISFQAFLATPEPTHPKDQVVTNQCVNNRQLYDKTAKYWTYCYAISDDNRKHFDANEFKDFEELIEKCVKKTRANRETALTALSCNHWDLDTAVMSLTND